MKSQISDNISAEAKLLFLAARERLNPPDADEFRDAARRVSDWQLVIRLGDLNRVQPMVYLNLKLFADEIVPARTMKALRAQTVLTAIRNENNLTELLALDNLMRGKNIIALHYKGATTGIRMYGDINLRTFLDMDFLSDKTHMESLCEVLESYGYRNQDDLDQAEQELRLKEQKEYLFRKAAFSIEPHWRFVPRRYEFSIDHQAIRSRADLLEIGTQKLLVPNVEDTLVLMMIVGAAGFWKRLQMLTDIAACTYAYPQLDWAWVEAEMNRLHARRILLLATFLARDICGARIPAALVREAEASKLVIKMAKRITSNLASPAVCLAARTYPPRRLQWLLWSMRDTWKDRITYLIRTTTTPAVLHTRRLPLPRKLWFLYYPLVPVHDYVLQPLVYLARNFSKFLRSKT